MNLEFIFKDFENTLLESINNGRSITYQLSALDLYNLDNLDEIRNDIKLFANNLDKLNKDDLNQIRLETKSILSKKRPHSQFGFYYGDFGKSYHRMQTNLSLIKAATNNEPNKTICEFGSNCGGWTALWYLHNNVINSKNYTVVDIIPEYCKILSLFGFNPLPINLAKENINQIIDNSFDVIILTEVLEHMKNESISFNLIESSLKVLNHNGSMIISYPRNAAPFVDHSKDPLGHQHQPDKERINQLYLPYFESVKMEFDGNREFHLFTKYKL